VGSASVPLAVGRVSRPTSWPACFVWIFLRLGGVVRDRIQNAGRPGCVWRDAKHRVRDARAPRKHRRSIGSTENVEEPRSLRIPLLYGTLRTVRDDVLRTWQRRLPADPVSNAKNAHQVCIMGHAGLDWCWHYEKD